MVVLKEISDLTPEKIADALVGPDKDIAHAKQSLCTLLGRETACVITDNVFNIVNGMDEIRAGGGIELAHQPVVEYLKKHPELLPSGNGMPQ